MIHDPMHVRKCNKTKAYGKCGSSRFSTIDNVFRVSVSATMSARWYSKASLSVDR